MNKNSGQALLVVLLVMAVLGTVVLSAVSRSVTDIAVTTKEDEAIRAFSAAEAGIEKGLLSGVGGTIVSGTGELPSGGNFSAQVAEIGVGSSSFKVPTPLLSGESATIWFVNHDQNGNITCSVSNPCSTANRMFVCWQKPAVPPTSAEMPAIEVSVYYQDGTSTSPDFSQVKIQRWALDTKLGPRGNFTGVGGSGGDQCGLGVNADSVEIGLLSNPRPDVGRFAGPIFVRLKLLYNTQPLFVGVRTRKDGTDVNLPKQGIIVTSIGQAGNATRKVVVNKLYSDVPPIFDFGLFSGSGDLVK